MVTRRRRGAPDVVRLPPERVRPPASPVTPITPPIVDIPPEFILHPGLRMRIPSTNLFRAGMPGRPVVRAEDLLALRIEFVNLAVAPGDPPRLKRGGAGPARIVLHFPPQSIVEQAVYQSAEKFDPDSVASPPLPAPPLLARIAGESRLSFVVPDDPAWAVPYRLSDLLHACSALELDVAKTATPRGVRAAGSVLDWIADGVRFLEALEAPQRARYATQSLRTARIQALESRAGAPTLHARSNSRDGFVARVPAAQPAARMWAERSVIDLAGTAGDFRVGDRVRERLRTPGSQPVPPGPKQTAIELPWRLIISPHAGARWQHASEAVSSPLTQRTELWHTRYTTLDSDGAPFDYPESDPNRTFRAVWARTGEHSNPPAFDPSPSAPQPPASTLPFRAALDDRDRFEFVHLSSDFARRGFVPDAIDAKRLMLSTLGGWLDSRGVWDPPGGLSVEEWVHRASLGRDHYVKVVRKGFLLPFGHRVSLIKETERKFHPTEPGNPAMLRQRYYIVVREPERHYAESALSKVANGRTIFYHRQFPLPVVRLLTQVTPDLDAPDSAPSTIGSHGPALFYPHVGGKAFGFRWAATDLDGRRIEFELPMIFIDNGLVTGANPQAAFKTARDEWLSPGRGNYRTAVFGGQRVALAVSVTPGDTLVEAAKVEFGAETDNLAGYAKANGGLRCYPSIMAVDARIPALSVLSGSTDPNTLRFDPAYLEGEFGAANPGEVFMRLAEAGESVLGVQRTGLDFSRQSDRSGGFVMPNLLPSGISRIAGPIAGDVAKFAAGAPKPDDFFKELSPLLFGVIPLGEVIASMTAAAGSPSMPSFVSEAATKVESFVGDLVRLLDLLRRLPDEAGRIGAAGAGVVQGTLDDLLKQAVSQLDTAQLQIAQYRQRIDQAFVQVNALVAWFKQQGAGAEQVALENAAVLNAKVGPVLAALNAGDVPLPAGVPAGFHQSWQNVRQRGETLLESVKTAADLVTAGKQVVAALDALVGDPNATLAIFSGDPAALQAKLGAIKAALAAFTPLLAGAGLLDGAPRQRLLDVIRALEEIFDVALASIAKLQELFGGEELVVRFDWKPELKNWALPGHNPVTEPLFRANDPRGFVVAVEARAKRNGTGTPKVKVVCSLKQFDLVLINPAGFIELNFEKIEFRVDSSAKMDVDVLLTDIKFIGVLSFVETLRDLIPLDGFSDPPHLDISAKGIDAGFDVALPNIAVGMFSLSNLSLAAGFCVPFIGQPLAVRFNFCTREQPFNLTVALFGGGGFFGITVDPGGVQILEAAFEFGANVSINLGVASGGVHVMAGIYFRMEQDDAQLAGYFRLGGYVSVLGLVSASLELYLELRYEFATGKAAGRAQLTIEISVLMFSKSVTISCERKFAGSNGDPTFAELMGPQPGEALSDSLAYPWREYCEAFA